MAKRTETFVRGNVQVTVKVKTTKPSVEMPRADRLFLNTVLDTVEAWKQPKT